jgi:hypothetical protein
LGHGVFVNHKFRLRVPVIANLVHDGSGVDAKRIAPNLETVVAQHSLFAWAND